MKSKKIKKINKKNIKKHVVSRKLFLVNAKNRV